MRGDEFQLREVEFGAFLVQREDPRIVWIQPTVGRVDLGGAKALLFDRKLQSCSFFVADAAVNNCIRELRQALDDDATAPRYIKTVHRIGYRVLAPVEIDRDLSSESSGVDSLLSDEEASLRLVAETQLAVTLSETRGWGASETGDAYERARRLSDVSKQKDYRLAVIWGHLAFLILRGRYDEALEVSEELMGEAQTSSVSYSMIWAYLGLGTCDTWRGRFADAERYYTQGLALYDAAVHRDAINTYVQDPKATMLAIGALDLWALGAIECADSQSAEALEWATAIGHPYALTMVTTFAAMLKQLEGDIAAIPCGMLWRRS